MNLKVKVTTDYESRNFQGKLHFENSQKSLSARYFLRNPKLSGSLDWGDELDVLLEIDGDEYVIKGKYPDILKEVPNRPRCVWVLAYDIIQENVFLISLGAKGSGNPATLTQRMPKEIDEKTERALFGEK